MAFIAKHLVITGIVQGVGFRPFLYRLLEQMQIKGEIYNSGAGVEMRIAVEDRVQLELLLRRLLDEKPNSSRVLRIVERADSRESLPTALAIVQNLSTEVSTQCPMEVAMCAACAQDLQAPTSRFYQYPFVSCAECGPRYGILRSLPFDRNSTAYRAFPRCRCCEADYQQPENRRFHAQTISCAACGPVLSFASPGEALKSEGALEAAITVLLGEGVVAIKSMSGFHLCCSAISDTAVQRLRSIKRRPAKPLAVMLSSSLLEPYVQCSPAELAALQGSDAPIVLLRKQAPFSTRAKHVSELADGIAPFQTRLGVMLPANGLQHLIMAAMQIPLVMTSANISGDALMVSNHSALQWLEQQEGSKPNHQAGLGVLLHNVEIERGLDDSVVFVSDQGTAHTLRLGRGKAPLSLPLPQGLPTQLELVALGGDLKNSFCWVHQSRLMVSEYFGDLKNLSVLQRQQKAIQDWRTTLFTAGETVVDIVVVDSHLQYLSHKQGVRWAKEIGAVLQTVDHHHAHAVSCMVEHNIPVSDTPIWALVCDGQGMSTDGGGASLWGAELLAVNYNACQRYGSLMEMPLLGGERAAIQPWRCALSLLSLLSELDQSAEGWSQLPCFAAVGDMEWSVFQKMATVSGASIRVSSAGRLFDGIYALVSGSAEAMTFEGQAAMNLQAMAERYEADLQSDGAEHIQTKAYPVDLQAVDSGDGKLVRVNPVSMLRALLADIHRAVLPEKMAWLFHHWFVNSFVELLLNGHKQKAQQLNHQGEPIVVLTGGVFQNQWLLRRFKSVLKQNGWQVLVPEQLPMNDQGLALGQAAIALARYK